MSSSKRYASIPLVESSACEKAFEQMEAAWQAADIELIGRALTGLSPHFIYSDYPWYKRWDELKPQVLRALWHGWTRERFWQIDGGSSLYSFEFHSALEHLADEFSESDLRELCQRYGFPSQRQQPRLWARLIEEPGEELSRWLSQKVEEDLRNEARLKAVATHASKSAFRVFHWQPWKPDVAEPVEILACRGDDVGHARTRQWLHELPFANDRKSVEALLRGVWKNRYPELPHDLEAALKKFSRPSDLRLVLLEFLEKLDTQTALSRFFADLRVSMPEDAIEGYLKVLESRLPEWKNQQEPFVTREMELVDFHAWPVLMRGYWASIAQREKIPLPRLVGLCARLTNTFVEFFDDTRPGMFGGCVMGLPLLFLVGLIIQIGLTLVLGRPTKPLMTLNLGTTALWAVCASMTMTSDFLHGGEARRTRFKMALCSFGSFAAMLILGVGSRVI